MPSAIDQRRLRDGATALEASNQASDQASETATNLIDQISAVRDGIAALQSLDDLGPEANERAERDQQELWKRMKVLEQRLKGIEGKTTKP